MADTAQASLMIGQTLGHYRILEKVASGGMGVVYLARDEQLEREVAVKVLPSGTLSDETARRRFRKEATALAKLNHPNIETVYDFGTQEGVDFLVMEYIPGKTLAERLARGTLPEREVISLGIQITSALEEAHERGIVHRDLKPRNIAITAKGFAKILDFGLARLLHRVDEGTTDTLSDSHAAAGTLPYMPPEQLRGEAVDARADIYTIGAVLYEMSTGRRAFNDELPSRLIEAILHQPPVTPRAWNPRISSELEQTILKCLDKDEDRRYQSAKELLVDLRRLQPTIAGNNLPPVPALAGSKIKRKMIYAATGVFVLAAGLLASNAGGWRDRLLGYAPSHQIRSLAVLPFENLSGNPDEDYFADGMTEALITDLGQIHTLRVISRTSVMRYKSAPKPLTQIARELHVDGIVEGSVSRFDGVTQVSAHLIHGPSDTQIWSKTYKRELQEVLTLEADVAGAIVHEINLSLTSQEQTRVAKAPAANFSAHDAYLKGRYHLNQGTEDHLRQAKQCFEQAIKADPNYAPAYAGLADYYWLTNDLPPSAAMPKAREFVEKALLLDNGLADAHATLATVNFYGDWDWAGAEKEYLRAIELGPSYSEVHRDYAAFLSEMGRHDQALLEIRKAQDLDPLSAITSLSAGWIFYYARQFQRAIEECQNVLNLDPHSVSARDCIGSGFLESGEYEQAMVQYRELASSSDDDPLRLASLGYAYAVSGKRAEAEKIVAQLNLASKTHYVPASLLGMIYAGLGNKDKAFSLLEKAFKERDGYLVRLRVEPGLDSLRPDPRFEALLRRLNL